MTLFISPEFYERYKSEVLKHTNAVQRYETGKRHRGLPDAEIAEKLGITKQEAAEIRSIAELEANDLSEFMEADAWKQERLDRKRVGGG